METTITDGSVINTSDEIKEDDFNKSWKGINSYSKFKLLLKTITIEPILICTVLPSLMIVITNQNLSLEKSCRVNLALDKEICDALSARNSSYPDYKTNEASVQRVAANLTLWKNVIQSLFPPLLLLFLGSWSDRHLRRKPLVLIALFGEICTSLSMLLCVFYFYEIPLEFVILGQSLPTVFTGGWAALFLGVFSYISNITTVETRTVRIGAVHTLFSVSCCIGISLSGIVFEKLGFKGKYK